jgi:hypothetical protein
LSWCDVFDRGGGDVIDVGSLATRRPIALMHPLFCVCGGVTYGVRPALSLLKAWSICGAAGGGGGVVVHFTLLSFCLCCCGSGKSWKVRW